MKKLEIDELTNWITEIHKILLQGKELLPGFFSENFMLDKSVKNIFYKFFSELKLHIYKEEKILFPYLINLSKSCRGEIPFELPFFGTVLNPIIIMKADHDSIEQFINQMRKYIIPYKIESKEHSLANKKLADFIDEVEKVIYFENEILFPHAVEAEKSLQNI